jgi:hypothetical protein
VLRPLAAGEAHLTGARYSVGAATPGEVGFKIYAAEGADVATEISQPSAYASAGVDGEKLELNASGAAATLGLHFGKKNAHESQPLISAPTIRTAANGAVTVAINIQIPPDFRESKASLLLECTTPGMDVKAEGRDNSKSISVAEMKSPKGAWHWFTVDLAPGSHALEFNLQMPAAARGGMQLSGWLRAKRGLVAKDLRLTLKPGEKLTAPPTNLLPASTEVEKLTYALVKETAL